VRHGEVRGFCRKIFAGKHGPVKCARSDFGDGQEQWISRLCDGKGDTGVRE
jgi:hypothetical protein